MSKKKATTSKATKPAGKSQRAKAAAAANPVRVKDVVRPPQAPPAGTAAAAETPAAGVAPPAGAGPMQGRVLPFKRPVSWNFAGVGRNDICPCGSGKRFKNCHGH